MARKTDYGKFILSAGEVGAYTVCPEAWRLRVIEQVRTQREESSKKGYDKHLEWAHAYEEVIYLGKRTHLVIVLIVTAAVLYMILKSR
jgi:hypothetical protein